MNNLQETSANQQEIIQNNVTTTFSLNRKKLQKILEFLLPTIDKKSPMDVITNFFVRISDHKARFYATNLENYISYIDTTNSNAKCDILLKAHLFLDIIKKCTEEDIIFEKNNNDIILKDKKGCFKLFSSIEEFPVRNVDDFKQIGKINYKDFLSAIKSIFLNVTEEDRGMFRIVVSNQEMTLICHDKRRLSICWLPTENWTDVSFFLNPKLMQQIQKLDCDEEFIEFYVNNNEIAIKNSEFFFITKMVSVYDFDYKKILKNKDLFLHFKVDTKELRNAAQRMKSLSSSVNKAIKLNFKGNILEISAFCPTAGSGNIELEGTGSSDTNAFIFVNVEFFIEALNCIETEFCTIYYRGSVEPLIVEGSAIYAMMPIRI